MSHPDQDRDRPQPGGRLPADPESVVDAVRQRYGQIASGAVAGCCSPAGDCGSEPDPATVSSAVGYRREQLAAAPAEANLGLGCGAPIEHLGLRPGETVLDLGSGGGFDALLAAAEVGDEGWVIGVDMTPEMIELARRNAARAGRRQVEFRHGRLEEMPVADATVDAVTSNCVINLVPDKAKVFAEIARVLKPGGRLVVADVVLDGELPSQLGDSLLAYVGCVAGAMERRRYFETVAAAGLADVEILKEVDFLATLGDALPAEAAALLARAGVEPGQLAGKVRSITFRAWKR